MDGGIDKVFIIDHLFALNQIDLLENCDCLSNVVVADTVLRYLNQKNIQAFHGLRNTLEMANSADEEAAQRRFFYLYNENFVETYLDEERDPKVKELLAGKGLDDKLRVKMSLVLSYYLRHLEGFEPKSFLLTTDAASKKRYIDLAQSGYLSNKLEGINL
jgi:hypothetical protein